MQAKNTVLEMTSYKILSFKYEKNKKFNNEQRELQIPFDFKTRFDKIDEDNILAEFLVDIVDEENFPFSLSLDIQGLFKASKWEEHKEQIELTISSILFPYIRALITTLTSTAGEHPITLPIINVATLMRNQKK